MAERPPRRWWRRCRRCLRWLRITIVLLVFFVVAAGVYLNEVGLPGFLKTQLVKKLRERGVNLQFTRLRWHLNRGFVAENVRFGRARATPFDPLLAIDEVELKVDHSALVKFQWSVDSLILHGGEVVLPVNETNEPPKNLSLTNIQAQLRFLTNDQWDLDNFSATFAGARLRLSGSLTNASAIRDWKIFQPGTGVGPHPARKRFRELAETLERIQFFAPPELIVSVDGDAREVQSFRGLLTLKAAGAHTPWGNLTNATLVARLAAPDAASHDTRLGFELLAAGAGTPWGGARDFQLTLHALRDENLTDVVHAVLEIKGTHGTTEWAEADTVGLTARWTHSLTNAIPLDGRTELHLSGIRTRWATLGELRLTSRIATPVNTNSLRADESWAWWAKLEPYALDWNCRLQDIHSAAEQTNTEPFELKELACGGLWRAPELTVTNLSAELYGGVFSLSAFMDVATRAITFHCASDFDIQKVGPFLGSGSQKWMKQYAWENPPAAHCAGGVILPSWTNRQPDWEGAVLPTLWMQGDFKAGKSAYREVAITSVESHFGLTNNIWKLPDLVAIRPEGRAELVIESDENTGNFYFHIKSGIDPQALRNLLDADAREGLDQFVFTAPPNVDGEIRGRWHDGKSLGFKAAVSLTNFTFRGESASSFRGDLAYTNLFLNLFQGRIERGSRYMTASGVGVDIPAQKLFLTNGFSTMEPAPVVHAIGRKVTKTIEPYQFLQPPTVRAYGTIPLQSDVAADLHFQIDGGPFHWMKFNMAHVTSEVNWVGDRMTVTNTRASFYKGDLTGSAAFDFSVDPGSDFSFYTTVTNVDLHALMADLGTRTNHLEGRLSGNLRISKANTDDWKSWFGSGHLNLRDGLIWDIPIFGRFSPILNWFRPGLGETRASEGTATFVITNSVIHSDTVEIKSPTLRLRYHGNVGFDGKLDSTMEAEVFHDAPLVGPVISTALMPLSKLFGSRVTGTLDEPKIEQRFLLPKLLLMPFHPFRSLNEIFTSPSSNNTLPPLEVPPPKTP